MISSALCFLFINGSFIQPCDNSHSLINFDAQPCQRLSENPSMSTESPLPLCFFSPFREVENLPLEKPYQFVSNRPHLPMSYSSLWILPSYWGSQFPGFLLSPSCRWALLRQSASLLEERLFAVLGYSAWPEVWNFTFKFLLNLSECHPNLVNY